MTEKKKQLKPKAILIDVIDYETSEAEAKKRLEELESLVDTFGGIVIVKTIQKKGLPDYSTYIGSGKVNEIIEIAQENNAEILVINNLLKARQLYELNERFRKAKTELKAWDRVDLILKIFSKHAKSTEAKLQIELASIKHMGPRIFGMGIELSRQAGALGLRAGQGESNIELMKRHLQKQELSILQKLKHYDVINEGHRKRRQRQNFKTAALVGYTNAGKSSLLKALTGKDVYIADELFATLSTRVGKLYIHPEAGSRKEGEYKAGQEILIADTIGFIRDLPPDLIKAFKSTLAETIEADLILHVIDVTDPQIHKKIKVVEEILEQLGLHLKDKLYIFNKMDLVEIEDLKEEVGKLPDKYHGLIKAGEGTSELLGWASNPVSVQKIGINKKALKLRYRKFTPVFISANEKTGLDELITEIKKRI